MVAIGANFLETSLPAEKRRKSKPSFIVSSVNSSIAILFELNSRIFPTERLDAKSLSCEKSCPRSSKTFTIVLPTSPVAPTIPIFTTLRDFLKSLAPPFSLFLFYLSCIIP